MVRLVAMLLATGVALSAVPAVAQTPADFVERFFGESIERLTDAVKPPAKPKPQTLQPAQTPLLAVPLPHLRPDEADPAAPLGFLPDPTTATVAIPTEDLPPMPRLRTSEPDASMTASIAPALPDVPPDPNAAPLVPLSELAEPPPAAQSTCGVSLAMLGVTAVPLQEVDAGACGMAAPVEVAALDGGAVDISGQAVVNCTMAEAFASWIDGTVGPIAERMLKAPVTAIRVAAGYNCRSRNNIPGAQLSEHAKGNAIDIAAFEVDGRWLTVGKAEGADAEFLAAVREAACGPFKTVLGPGSDAYHSDHFHLDLAHRRNGSTYCR
jgi:hypothetical protein